MDSVYSQRIRAGKRRTYFFDVRETRGNDYYLTITESRKKFNEDGYDRHKIFLYKEDFNKFLKGMTEAIDFVKTDLMPDFDFDAFNHDQGESFEGNNPSYQQEKSPVSENKVEESPTSEVKEPEAPETPEAAADVEPKTDETANEATDPPPDTSHQDEEVDKW